MTQFLETWSRAGCIHRCDGRINWLTGEECDPDDPDHINAKPTTRLKVVLKDVEGIGVFRLESHGWNAAAELPDAAVFLEMAGDYVAGWLALEERSQIRHVDGKPQTQKFMVPVIDIDITPAQLLAGRSAQQQAVAGGERPALEGAPSIPDYIALAEAAQTLEKVREIWHEADDAGHLTEHLRAALTVIGQRMNPPIPPVPQAEDLDALWMTITGEAGRHGMTQPDLEEDFEKFTGGVTSADANAVEMNAYLDDLKGRQQ